MRHQRVLRWVEAGLKAVDPEVLVEKAIDDMSGPQTLIAIGKAAPAMVRGVARRTNVDGICVTDREDMVPASVELLIGEHPVPGPGSRIAAQRALALKADATLALVSGGGSAICELPLPGLAGEFVNEVNRRLLKSGLPIASMNMVRASMSQIKCGGLGPLRTLVLSDVAGQSPEVVSSGPTAYMAREVDDALEVVRELGVTVSADDESAMRAWRGHQSFEPRLTVIGDGRTAASAIARTANGDGLSSAVSDRWITEDLSLELDLFLSSGAMDVMVGAGEPTLRVTSTGTGGRNTHAALEAARRIEGTDLVFAAVASDGRDGNSGLSGAIVDGSTIRRGGDPTTALATFDSASYLDRTGDTIDFGVTGTNVADLWLVWRSGLY